MFYLQHKPSAVYNNQHIRLKRWALLFLLLYINLYISTSYWHPDKYMFLFWKVIPSSLKTLNLWYLALHNSLRLQGCFIRVPLFVVQSSANALAFLWAFAIASIFISIFYIMNHSTSEYNSFSIMQYLSHIHLIFIRQMPSISQHWAGVWGIF